MFDVLIIGAGITGSLIAHDLSKKDLNVCLLEKGNDVACGASKANSAIIHSGHDPKPNTLKAKFNLEGNKMYPNLCKELQVDYSQVGAYVVSTSDGENEVLKRLENQSKERDIPYSIISGDELRKIEPNISKNVVKALYLPTTGIITPWQVCIAAVEEAMENGLTLHLNQEVISIEKENDVFKVFTKTDVFETKVVANCAGVYADKISNMLGLNPYTITAKKGEYFVLEKMKKPLVNHIIYPVPSSKGKGVLAVPTIHGNILLGPNSNEISDKEDVSTGDDLEYVRENVYKILDNVAFNKVIHTYSGLRPSGNIHDFHIQEDENVDNFIHVACIESPGLASAPAISKYVVNSLILPKFNVSDKKDYKRRREHIDFSKLSIDEKNKLIKENSDYGKIICRCEQITLGEIKDVINRKCGATTIQQVKRRVRPGMGKCQGGFCQSSIVSILASELNVDIKDICDEKLESNIIVAKAKEDF